MSGVYIYIKKKRRLEYSLVEVFINNIISGAETKSLRMLKSNVPVNESPFVIRTKVTPF